MKTIFCDDCGDVVAHIKSGSKLRKNCVMLCGACDQKRKTNIYGQNQQDFISKLFDGFKR